MQKKKSTLCILLDVPAPYLYFLPCSKYVHSNNVFLTVLCHDLRPELFLLISLRKTLTYICSRAKRSIGITASITITAGPEILLQIKLYLHQVSQKCIQCCNGNMTVVFIDKKIKAITCKLHQ